MEAHNMADTQVDKMPWYAVRLFGCRALKAKDYFEEKGLECFVPVNFRETVDELGRKQRKLMPVVNNLVFIKKQLSDNHLQTLIQESGMKMSVVTKARDTRVFYEIPPRQMLEFRIMCNPDVNMRFYLSPEEAQLKAGIPVLVTHGPLTGITGRLVRQSHKYFLLKEIPGLAVMLKVTRWCCQPVLDSTAMDES